MTKKLTLEDRYHISMYSRKLPCTLELRFAIDAFLDQIEITPEEMKTRTVKVTQTKFECNDPESTTEYKDFPKPVTEAMESYIEMLDHDKNKDNVFIHKTFDYFRKVI
jgi:hypothetical protein